MSASMRTACSTTAPSQVQSSTSPSTQPPPSWRQPHAVGAQRERRRCAVRHSDWPARSPRRRAARDDCRPAGPRQDVAAADEARDERIGRPRVHRLRRADLLHAALVHHHQPVGQRHRLGLVVRHHDRGDAAAPLQDADLARHLLAQLGVEIGQRLVEQQHARLDRQRAGQCDALLLAAGKLAGQARRRTPRASPGAAFRPRALARRPARMRRISRPKAMLRATERCGNSA